MSRIERFEDLIAWQKTRDLTGRIYRLTQEGAFARDFKLRDAIRQASISAMARIAEGFERRDRQTFGRYLQDARGSCAAARSHLHAARDSGYIQEDTQKELFDLMEEASKVISGLARSLQRKDQPRREPQEAAAAAM